jgi:large subunit ribosomal protein L21
MYAVIETGGKQYRVELGTELEIDRLDAAPGDTVELGRVLLVADGDRASIGRPVVEGASVSASVVRQDRADKIVVFKYRPKARRRVKHGHRQDLTVVRVADIVFDGRSAATQARAEAEAAERARVEAAAAAERRAIADRALAEQLAEAEAEAEKAAKAEGGTVAKRTRRRSKPAESADEPAGQEEPKTPRTTRTKKDE